MVRTQRQRILLAIVSGLALAGAQAPLSLWPFLPLGLIGALIAFQAAPSTKSAGWTGWALGTAYFAASMAWIVEPFFVDAARHGWMAPFALLFLSGGLALFWAFPFWAAQRLSRPWTLLALWPLSEMLRGVIFTGFPWGLWSYAWLDTPVSQIATWIGPFGLMAVTLWLCALPVLWSWRAGSSAMLAGFALLATLGHWDRGNAPAPQNDAPIIRITQPNAPQHQKWDRDYIPIFFRRQITFTEAEPKPDLIVWPETSVPAWLNEAERALESISSAAGDVPVVLGIQRYLGRDAFNTAAVLSGAGEILQVYDKHHLVPFGEYLPLSSILSKIGLGIMVETASGFTAGPGPQLIELPGIGAALPLICYEAVFPRLSRSPAERPRLLLHLTNDAWFGGWAGPQQHLAQARFRAIEQGLPLIRSANTGISAVIDAKGDVLQSLPLGKAGYLDVALPSAAAPTFYAKTSDWLALMSLMFLLCATLLPRRKSRD